MEPIKTLSLGRDVDTRVADVVMALWVAAQNRNLVGLELGKHNVKELMKEYRDKKYVWKK